MYRLTLLILVTLIFAGCNRPAANEYPNVIVSTDIGGSDPDDYQSMIHFLLYADRFNIMGLISSPPDVGRKQHIEEVIAAYANDYSSLRKHSERFPTPEYLLGVTKQGATEAQAQQIPCQPSEGASWIIEQAKLIGDQPLYVVVWGSITDVAQAVHHSPEIKAKLRIYSIGSWNTVQDENARNYLYNNHTNLWWIENNTSFRGMYQGGYKDGNYGNETFVVSSVKDYGALGKLFWEKKEDIKMGDTPSVLYFLDGAINDPEGDSWGGSFIRTSHGPHYWTDNPADSLQFNKKAGAITVNKHRKAYLDDWRRRMQWLAE